MAEFDFDGDYSQSIGCKSSVLSLSSKSSTSSKPSSLSRKKRRLDSILFPTKTDDDASLNSRHSKVSLDQEQEDDKVKSRHVRFSLSSNSQDSSSLDPSLRRVVESTLPPSDSVATTSSSSNNSSSSSEVRRASCLRHKNGNSYSQSQRSNNSSSIESHITANSNSSFDKTSVGSSTTRVSRTSVASKSNSPQRQRRRRLNYSSGGLKSATSDAPLPLQPVLETTHDGDDDDQLHVNKVSSTSHPMQMRQEMASERAKPILVDEPESKPVRGAGANVFAIQDAGTQQMMADECAYLCSTILSSPIWSQNVATPSSRRIKALEIASCDLALLLSTSKTRCVLWADGRPSNSGAMLNILNVLGTINSPNMASSPPLSRQLTATPTQLKQMKNTMDEEVNSQETATSAEIAQAIGEETFTAIPTSFKITLAAMLHFLSWDCTLSEYSAAQLKCGRRKTQSVASMARRIRQHLLQHPQAMQAVGQLIVDDPVTRRILLPVGEQQEEGEMILEPASQESVMSDISGGASQGSVRAGLSALVQDGDSGDNPNDAASVNSKASHGTAASGDPTAVGRRRRKRKRLVGTELSELEPIAEENKDEMDRNEQRSATSPPRKRSYGNGAREGSPGHFSFTSSDSPLRSPTTGREDVDEESRTSKSDIHIREKLASIQSKLILPQNGRVAVCCSCRIDESALGESPQTNPSSTALHALNRIIAGKEGDEESCMDQEDQEASQSQSSIDDNEEETNPLLVTNRLLGESGILPYLAQGLAESVQAVACFIQPASKEKSGLCLSCLAHLYERVSGLAALVDGACCLNSENRRTFCNQGQERSLIGSLVILLHSTSNLRESDEWVSLSDDDKLIMSDILLIVTRLLTSLTHENELAAQQLVSCHRFSLPSGGIWSASNEIAVVGVEALSRLCYLAVEWRAQQATDKHVYDVIIFCLNTLSNTMDVYNARDNILELNLPETGLAMPDSNQTIIFLSWLARWLVSETESFRDIIMQGTFGASSTNKVESRDLQKDEEESLVVSGHGMVVLACAMTTARTENLARIKELVIKEMPLRENGASSGLLLVKNTLKAFCNFYRFSLGELSVAVVDPVRNLLAKLDEIENGQ